MGFIIAIIFINTFTKVLVSLFLYYIPVKININEFQRLEELIIIYRIANSLFNINALI